ncbi:hypothetical protein M514_25296 [Trichuris suis]|uniref:Uncharacterized protein n=1 Tax=Trichuris suis TaxID=68888 RepID=A0A085MZB4_9BILA|nr:hypothetical protein M514_25296 [Trichuris suis]
MHVNGVERTVLVDTGCTNCIAHESCCKQWKEQTVTMTTLNDGVLQGKGVGTVWLQPMDRPRVQADVIICQTKPLGFDFILGINGIKKLRGLEINHEGRVRFRPTEGTVCAATDADITLDERDFVVTFDRDDCSWRASWKWTNGGGPDVLKNIVREYPPSREIRGPYEEELRSWVEQGWLVPYDQTKYGPAKGLIPLMAIVQRNKGKIRPVMDFRELNAHIETVAAG